MKVYVLVTLCVTLNTFNLFAQEPSAFGAGSLDNPSPYGLTSSEKVTLQNKKELKNIKVKTNNQSYEVDSLRERIDGLQSIVESLNRKSQDNKILLSELQEQNIEKTKNSNEYELRLGDLIQSNTANIQKNITILDEMNKLLNHINQNYVSKDEFTKLVNSVNKFKGLVTKELKNTTASKEKKGLDTMSNAEVAKDAKVFYDKKFYTKGIEYYSHLILKNYKPAYAHFMIGQMNFHRKNYANAISFYKKSASLYSEASYMPELMLNTAISMEKTKDFKNARAFYNGVIVKYPDSKEAYRAEVSLKYIE